MLIINKKLALIGLLNAFLLSACNEMQQSKPATQTVTKYTATSVLFSGKVENKTGNVEALDGENVVASTNVENGRYQLEIPAQTKLPIVLRSDKFVSAVVDTDLTSYDINSLTTNIAAKAKALGGYTRQNMILAASNSVHTPDANKTSTGFRGDPTSQYGGWH
ncbi:MAG: hypothetical protein NTZ70_05610 [Methylococcales bacterium]|nr:hypothetical protein [Methylococcales bacterium]